MSVRSKADAKRYLTSLKNLRPSRFRPKIVKKRVSPMVKPFVWNPANWKPEYAPRGRPLGHGETKERRAYSEYVAKIPFSASPKYGPESPTLRRLRRAMLKSEGVKISASPTKNASPNKKHLTCPEARKKLISVIGRGRQGIVYKGHGFAAKICPKDMAAAERKEPQPSIVEFNIQQKVFEAAPKGVVAPYDILHCLDFIKPSDINMKNVQNSRKYDKSKQSIIFMEFCSGGSLDAWLEKKGTSDAALHHVISSVIGTLAKIRTKYPDFRHNDLWPGNVMVADRGFLIGDFGWARLEKDGTNPAVNTANGTNTAGKWGVGPSTDSRYDCHLFLNNLRDFVKRKGGLPKTSVFLDWAVPEGYRGSSSEHVQEWRLKYKDPCSGLPSLAQVARSKYITGRKVTSPDLVEARAKLKKVPRRRLITSPNLAAARAKLKKIVRGSAQKAKKKAPVSVRELKAAKEKLKPARPLRKLNIPQLKAAKEKLKPAVKTKHLTKNIFKHPKFDKLIEWYWRNNGAKSGNTSHWNAARNKAVRLVELRLHRGNVPFSPERIGGRVVPKKVVVTKILSIPRKASAEAAKPLGQNLKLAAARLRQHAAKLANQRAKTVVVSPPKPKAAKAVHMYSPKSGRIKIMGPTGRMAYVNGSTITMNFVKALAAQRGVNIKGLRSKVNIAKRIFSRNNK
jgi:serine/threonine protein kinase